MEIKKAALAGTLESSDCQVQIEPQAEGKLEIEINSTVEAQYGKAIRNAVEESLAKLEVKAAKLSLRDQGALDCTIRARVQTAVLRASEVEGELPWGTQL